MKLILKFVISYLCFADIIDSKMMRMQPNDELYRYTIDPSVSQYTDYVSTETLVLEQIDDEIVQISGYVLFLKSMDPRMPMQMDIKTKCFQNAVWKDALFRLTLPSLCQEFLNPERFWYNVSKLWTNCPPQKMDKWLIANQTIDARTNLPSSLPSDLWQAFVMLYQWGTQHKFGLMIQVELKEID